MSANNRHFILEGWKWSAPSRKEVKAMDELYEGELIPNACTRATQEGHEVAPHTRVFGDRFWRRFPTFGSSGTRKNQYPL
jgi:hypothetical protein